MTPVSTTLLANFATSYAGVVDIGNKLATGVNDTGGKFASCVYDASGKLPLVSTTPVGTMGTISACWQLKVNLKEKMYLYANSATQRCPKEITKTFLIKDFSICHHVNDTTSGAPSVAKI
jgi:hypothetical protein